MLLPGVAGQYECLPASKHQIRADQLEKLRCGSLLREPGGLKEPVVHVWLHRGHEVSRQTPNPAQCDGDGSVFLSELDPTKLPKDPVGKWQCETWTRGGQLVGVRNFEIITKDGKTLEELHAGSAAPTPSAPHDAGVD